MFQKPLNQPDVKCDPKFVTPSPGAPTPLLSQSRPTSKEVSHKGKDEKENLKTCEKPSKSEMKEEKAKEDQKEEKAKEVKEKHIMGKESKHTKGEDKDRKKVKVGGGDTEPVSGYYYYYYNYA